MERQRGREKQQGGKGTAGDRAQWACCPAVSGGGGKSPFLVKPRVAGEWLLEPVKSLGPEAALLGSRDVEGQHRRPGGEFSLGRGKKGCPRPSQQSVSSVRGWLGKHRGRTQASWRVGGFQSHGLSQISQAPSRAGVSFLCSSHTEAGGRLAEEHALLVKFPSAHQSLETLVTQPPWAVRTPRPTE